MDVGAYLGDTAYAMKKAVGPAGRVMAFEPNPMGFECLERNVGASVECYRLAVAGHIPRSVLCTFPARTVQPFPWLSFVVAPH